MITKANSELPRGPVKLQNRTDINTPVIKSSGSYEPHTITDHTPSKALHPIEVWWKLLFSIDDGNLKAFRQVLERVQDISSLRFGPNQDHLLHILAERKVCAPFLQLVLEKRVVDLNVTNMLGQTPLHKAAAIHNC